MKDNNIYIVFRNSILSSEKDKGEGRREKLGGRNITENVIYCKSFFFFLLSYFWPDNKIKRTENRKTIQYKTKLISICCAFYVVLVNIYIYIYLSNVIAMFFFSFCFFSFPFDILVNHFCFVLFFSFSVITKQPTIQPTIYSIENIGRCDGERRHTRRRINEWSQSRSK